MCVVTGRSWKGSFSLTLIEWVSIGDGDSRNGSTTAVYHCTYLIKCLLLKCLSSLALQEESGGNGKMGAAALKGMYMLKIFSVEVEVSGGVE